MPLERSDFSHLSFEFFPPKTPREFRNLLRSASRLSEFKPDFYSVTQGAGGSAREGTLETVRLLHESGYNAIPHMTWGADTRRDMAALLHEYAEIGVSDMVVLRGDIGDDPSAQKPFRYAHELVSLIREETGDKFRLHVGCYPEMHPEATSIRADISRLKEKLDAGADSCITQYFFNADAYWAFVESCFDAGIEKAILPGVMPIASLEKLVRFSEKCGAEIPRWLMMQLRAREHDSEQLREYGADVVANLCRRLLNGGALGLHVYTLNLARPTQEFLGRLLET